MITNNKKKYNLRNYKIKNETKCKNNKNNLDIQEIIEFKEEIDTFHNTKECFVCLEVYIDNSITVKLNNMKNYIKQCSCDGWIHEYCFNSWHLVNPNCPICRSVIIFTKYEYYILTLTIIKKQIQLKIIFIIKLLKIILLYFFVIWCIIQIFIDPSILKEIGN